MHDARLVKILISYYKEASLKYSYELRRPYKSVDDESLSQDTQKKLWKIEPMY